MLQLRRDTLSSLNIKISDNNLRTLGDKAADGCQPHAACSTGDDGDSSL